MFNVKLKTRAKPSPEPVPDQIASVRALAKLLNRSHSTVLSTWLCHPEWPFSSVPPWPRSQVPAMKAWAATHIRHAAEHDEDRPPTELMEIPGPFNVTLSDLASDNHPLSLKRLFGEKLFSALTPDALTEFRATIVFQVASLMLENAHANGEAGLREPETAAYYRRLLEPVSNEKIVKAIGQAVAVVAHDAFKDRPNWQEQAAAEGQWRNPE